MWQKSGNFCGAMSTVCVFKKKCLNENDFLNVRFNVVNKSLMFSNEKLKKKILKNTYFSKNHSESHIVEKSKTF